jgi:catechol 2,3-dioxygenase-like lactoylglutathione lyase family enzyme
MSFARFSLVALDCRDPHALAAFYQRVLGGEITVDPDVDDWVELALDSGSNLAFQLDPEHRAPEWPDGLPQQAHLDLEADDLDEAERLAIAAGAVKASVQPDPENWRVMIDPAGHPFCFVTP